MNTTTNPVNKHGSTTEFVQTIKTELEAGCAFVPFVGSGISAQSGILMSQEFSDYLAYCVWRALGCPRNLTESPVPWNFAELGWPPFPTTTDVRQAKSFLCTAFRVIAENYGCTVEHEGSSPGTITLVGASETELASGGNRHLRRPLVPTIIRSQKIWSQEEEIARQRQLFNIPDRPWDVNASPTSRPYITEVAVRALSHWTLTLEFLASVRVDEANPSLLFLGDRDVSIIDSFNQHITRGKHPSLIHNMLARIARSLRSRLILTTNFDSLLEQAFTAQGKSIQTIAVSARGELPAFATVRAQDSLIKLHGDLLETRADTSINTPPTNQDKARFYQYLRGPQQPPKKSPPDYVPSHLLVIGYSASDARCVHMIKYVLDLDDKFKVFWICHSHLDETRIKVVFKNHINKPDRFHLVVTDRADLLLWELYQTINHSLPGGGYRFKFTDHVPPSLSDNADDAKYLKSLPEKAKNKLSELYGEIERTTGKNRFVTLDYASGLAGPSRELFRMFTDKGRQALWFELEDNRDTMDVVWEVLGAIALRRGVFTAEAVNFLPHELGEPNTKPVCDRTESEIDDLIGSVMARIRLLCERYGIVAESYVLFMYGRNGPGGCSGWTMNYWNKAEHLLFTKVLDRLAKMGFRIIYMPLGRKRFERNKQKVKVVRDLITKNSLGQPSDAYREWLNEEFSFARADSASRDATDDAISATYPCPVSTPEFQMDDERKCIDTWDSYLMEVGLPRRQDNSRLTTRYEGILDDVLNDFLHLNDKGISDAMRGARAIWLYGLTLFRQSRHSAAMISDAVFPCPWRFNRDSFDNDCSRYERVFVSKSELAEDAIKEEHADDADRMGWANWLETKGLFLKKAGGFSWIYRDTRLAIQHILELHQGFEQYPEPFRKQDEGSGFAKQSLWDLRARVHYWISDWYLKALNATGHFTPLVEAIYHAAMSIRLARFYVPQHQAGDSRDSSQLWMSRAQIAWSALCLLRQAIRDGKGVFMYWCPGVNVEQVFLDRPEFLHKTVDELKTNLPDSRLVGRLEDDIKGGHLWKEIEELRKAVMVEGYSHLVKAMPLALSRGFATKSEAPPALSIVLDPANNDAWDLSIVQAIGDAFDESGGSRPDLFNPAIDTHRAIRSLRLDWTRKWDIPDSGSAKQDTPDFDSLFQLAWNLSSITYHILRRAKLLYHTEASSTDGPRNTNCLKKAQPLWRIACVLAHHSLMLCRLLPPRYEPRERELRVRLLSTYGLALACLRRPTEANRRFHEAHALALTGGGDSLPLQMARIQLRRAEMFLHRAYIALYDPLEDRQVSDEDKDGEIRKMRLKAFVEIDDAWAGIERGEQALSGRSHSSFWWYRIAVTKLSCLAVLARLASHLGVRAGSCLALRKRQHLPSVIEGLLRNALFAADGDPFRELRAIDYALWAATMPGHQDEIMIHDNAEPTLPLGNSWLSNRILSFVDQFYKRVAVSQSPKSKKVVSLLEKRPLDTRICNVLGILERSGTQQSEGPLLRQYRTNITLQHKLVPVVPST